MTWAEARAIAAAAIAAGHLVPPAPSAQRSHTEKMKEYWTPERRAAFAARKRTYWTPEARQAHSERLRAAYARRRTEQQSTAA
jgi:hypothetical protein